MPVLTWLLSNWRLVCGVVALVGSFIGGWMQGADTVQRKWDIDIYIRTAAALEATKKNQAIIIALEEKKNANMQTIDRLAGELAGYRVRVPKAPCVRPDTAPGGQDAAPATRTGADTTQEAFDRFTAGLAEDAKQHDTVIESCRVLRDWAKSTLP